MGKSIRSKIKKRLRTAKRQRVDAMICTPREQEKNESLRRVMEGRQVTLSKPRNAFKYPKEKDAVFPQHEIMKPIDFRSENLPMAAYAFRGNRRKYEGDQKEYMQALSKDHPKMEVMAGGGAVLATTGEKVSKREAELIATAQRNPEAAAASSAPASASSAVAEALEEERKQGEVEEGECAMEEAEEAKIEPENAADHSRRPVLKDDRRAKRTAAHRPRAKQAGKKGKASGGASATSAAAERPSAKVKKGGKTKANGDQMAD